MIRDLVAFINSSPLPPPLSSPTKPRTPRNLQMAPDSKLSHHIYHLYYTYTKYSIRESPKAYHSLAVLGRPPAPPGLGSKEVPCLC